MYYLYGSVLEPFLEIFLFRSGGNILRKKLTNLREKTGFQSMLINFISLAEVG